jgi:hypothetical protein
VVDSRFRSRTDDKSCANEDGVSVEVYGVSPRMEMKKACVLDVDGFKGGSLNASQRTSSSTTGHWYTDKQASKQASMGVAGWSMQTDGPDVVVGGAGQSVNGLDDGARGAVASESR